MIITVHLSLSATQCSLTVISSKACNTLATTYRVGSILCSIYTKLSLWASNTFLFDFTQRPCVQIWALAHTGSYYTCDNSSVFAGFSASQLLAGWRYLTIISCVLICAIASARSCCSYWETFVKTFWAV